MNRIVVAGASLAGVNAAQTLREAGFAGEIVLLGAEADPPYDRPPLSKEALLAETTPHAIALRSTGWYADNGITLRLGTVAAALDPGRRVVTLADGTEAGYDALIVATGAAPPPLPPEYRAPGVLTLRRLPDMVALRQALAPGARLLVIGAGFIGLELAATARTLGTEVTVIEVAAAPLARVLGDEVGGWLAARHRAQGADVRCGRTVQWLDGGPGGYRAGLNDGTVLQCDVVVAATGVRPATGWLRGSGLRLGDGVRCDAYCRTSAPDVVAAGDVARWYNPLFDEDMRIEHWTNAVEQGRAAALSVLGLAASAYAPVPFFWSDHYGLRIRFAGRAYAAAGVHIEERGDGSLVALYQRDGVIRGALCVGAMRELVVRRQQILNAERWEDVVPGGAWSREPERVPD